MIAKSHTAALLAFFFTLLLATPAGAQASKVGATLEGTVRDSSGAIIPGAEIRLRNTATNYTRLLRSDDQGFFRASELDPGTYALRAEHPGFAPYLHTGVTLTVGQTAHLEIILVPSTVTTQLTVTDQPPVLDPSQTSQTTTVENEKIEELPVRSRNYLDFVLLAPGVVNSPQPSSSSAQTFLAGSGFTFGGLRARSNNLSIDGLENNDEYAGASRTELSLELVREFQVVNNGLLAESGGSSGGSINVVTKSGTNQLRGDLFLFAQTGALNARPPLSSAPQKPHLTRYRAGFSIGGPLIRDRTFYYTAFEQEHLRGEERAEIDPAVASAINGFLAGGASPGLGTRLITTGLFPVARAETEASGKINHKLSDRHTLMVRYAFTNNREAGAAFNTDALTDASARGSSFTEDHALVGSFTSLLGARLVGDLRFQLATRRVTLRSNDARGPGVNISGVLNLGRPYEGNSRRRENHAEVSYALTLSQGPHLLKAGLTVDQIHLRAFVPDEFGGFYLFPSVDAFVRGRPDTFRQAFGDASTSHAVTGYGAFVQDHWSASRRVTLDLGMRYDFESLPSGIHEDRNNFAPRIGLSYSPASRWVLRAGFGIFFDRYVLAFLNRALQKDGQRAFEQVADADAAATIFQQTAGGSLPTPLPTIQPSIFRADPRLATSYSQQASFGAQLLLSKNLTAGVNYLFVRGIKLARTRNSNLLPPITLTPQNASHLGVSSPTAQQIGRPVFGQGRGDPRFDDIYLLEDSANSTYHGLSITLNRRLADELTFLVSYTLSSTRDDASDFDEQPENPFDLNAERSVSRNHQRQRLVVSALWELPLSQEEKGTKGGAAQQRGPELLRRIFGHIEFAPILTVASGRPANPLVGLDSNRSHASPLSSRPLNFGRNSLETPGLATLDLRVLKFFPVGEHGKLDFVAEFFNLFNRTNVSQISPFFGSALNPMPTFGKPTDTLNARQIQFSLDFEF